MEEMILEVIGRYFPVGHPGREIFLAHSMAVADYSLLIARKNKHLNPDLDLVYYGAMLHDIGIAATDAPQIGCCGVEPYIRHGVLGADLLRENGLAVFARFCECHIGTGISVGEIVKRKLPLPLIDMKPETIEEKIVCVADKFFSKSSKSPETPRTVSKILKALEKHGKHKPKEFIQLLNELLMC
ncbi:MAG: HDIG domain-containing protein [Bacteroidetes bacterium]|nr:HDIG domain-containing protein [Bacteroidota bacterium]MBU1720930.1 HDIG domain-containing protein [Bacteroidota bacterium]